jgi:hypothetical protein
MKCRPRKGEIVSHPRFGTGRVLGNWGTFFAGSERCPAMRSSLIRHPQMEVLKRTSVCITHAALNTVLESLVQGVPQVGIPITVDQPGWLQETLFRSLDIQCA